MASSLRWTALLACGVITLAGCEADYHARRVRQADEANRLTVGTVQREIERGMAADQVAVALGSPNIVTTDEQSREVWIYDKMATEVVASGSSWFVTAGAATFVTAGAATTRQRTLTIVVKFDENKRVRDIAYHSSSF